MEAPSPIDASHLSGQSGIQDFCFLMKAQKELVGSVVSTFVRWPAY
jgi:hypothetical protein